MFRRLNRKSAPRMLAALMLLSLLPGFALSSQPAPARAANPTNLDTPNPTSVTIAGSLQDELGCSGDWQADCALTHLTYDANDDVWQGVFNLPAGNYEYKAALNDGWDENYGLHGVPGGANIPLPLAAASSVKFYYDHKSHWITDNKTSIIATIPGSFQSELGCSGDWAEGCLRSWLQDLDGDGIYNFETTAIPAGSYEAKVTINESWAENYGAGGVPNGPNIPFTVPANGVLVRFTYDSVTHILTITAGHGHDNNVEYDGLGHNSQDLIYRQPFGATNPGTPVTLRFRTFHDDVTGVRVRFYDTATSTQFFAGMNTAATDVSCYDALLATETCDYWQTTVTPTVKTTLYYRFIVTDGTAVAYYADDSFKDGGWGLPTATMIDNSYPITVFDPSFQPIPWMKNAVIYQIFPDRFRSGRTDNDPTGNEPRYGYPPSALDQIIKKPWGTLPEGYCRDYVNPAQPCTEGPRGRDYFGGDLKGVDQELDYLRSVGVNTIYFNPIFDAASNHAYDTQDYYQIDPFFGSQKDWDNLVKHATQRGMKVILDGVFNHVSSDSPYFDRYEHFSTLGACESVASPYRSWFTFRAQAGGPCAGPGGPNTMNYDGWFGFDSLPVLNKNDAGVRALFYDSPNSVGSYWLNQGADGWRLDVMGDGSFPDSFWQGFRQTVKATDPAAPIIGELWKKDEILPKIHGDIADTTMNYRFRNAVLGFFGKIDNKGFVDDGQSDQPPSLFARKLNSLREDYPDATYYTLMNLMDSHDTKRILWSLTPGQDNREEKEFNAANLAVGKQMMRLAAMVQFTIPGAPTVYYGDENAMTGADDPDDRRTFPWMGDDPGGDQVMRMYYTGLSTLRANNAVFRNGALKFLLTDDANRTLAYGMRTAGQVAIVAINRNSNDPKTLNVPTAGYLRDGVAFTAALGTGSATTAGGHLQVTLPALGGVVLLANAGQDLTPPAAPVLAPATEGNGQVGLSWGAVAGASQYRVYRSPLSGGGFEPVGTTGGTSFTSTNLRNGTPYYFVVTSLDALGNESGWSNQVSGLPHYTIGWANVQWPPTLTHTISAVNRTDLIYGQVWINGVTNVPGPTASLRAQVGFGPTGSNPAGNAAWTWEEAVFNADRDNNDEFKGSLLPEQTGNFDYAYRYTTTGGRDWLYADLDGTGNGYSPAQAGHLTVNPSSDTTPPAAPQNLRVTGTSLSSITLGWDANTEPDLYGYEVWRGAAAGGPYTRIATVSGATQYVDSNVDSGSTYFYVLKAIDLSFNRSGASNEVSATAEPRMVAVTFNVTVPAYTPMGDTIYIAGSFPPPYPQWDPGALNMTRVDTTHATTILNIVEGTQVEYKYTRGSWNSVEKGPSCEEIANRQVTVVYGSSGTQTVNDTVAKWRDLDSCP